MGIKGLLQFLKGAQRDVHIESFRGQTAAVDAYCWLHKGAYSCAKELVTKEKNLEDLPFLRYCMKRVNLLRKHDITLIIVFDGARLPMKAHTEKERRERRHEYLTKGKALLKSGKNSEAVECFQRCVDVSPQMALAFIRLLRSEGIQVIVAPYEADAQLAYLVKNGLAHFVITEDSDLLVFGCSQVLFKMDDAGHGKLIELQDIGKGTKSLMGFTPESFRHVGILCGCDYLPSIQGVGPSTAIKLMRKFNKDPYRVIRSLKSSGKVPSDYEENFRRADHTFLYQLVFDPVSQKQVHLTTPPNDIDIKTIEEYTGLLNSPSKQVGLARGNINPLTLEQMDTYSPSKQDCSSSCSGTNSSAKSMKRSQTWSGSVLSRSGSLPHQTTLPVSKRAKQEFRMSVKKNVSGAIVDTDDGKTEDELTVLYGDGNCSSDTSETTTVRLGESVSRNIFSKSKGVHVGHTMTVVSNNQASSSLDALDQFEKKHQTSSVDSGIDIRGEKEGDKEEKENSEEMEDENEEKRYDYENEVEEEEDDKGEGKDDIKHSVEHIDKETNSIKRKLFEKQEKEDYKRHKPDDINENEENDCAYVTSSSVNYLKFKTPFRRLGLTKTSKKPFAIPRPASGSLHSYFSYKPKEKL